jgi:Uri superfamily endonuclease
MVFYWAFVGSNKKAEGSCRVEDIKSITENASMKGWHVNFIKEGKLIASV